MKFVLVPDSFKGTLSASDVCTAMEKGLRKVFPACETVSLPVADGGEGTVDAFLTALGGKKIAVSVQGPFEKDVSASFALLPDGETAVVEMAACAGLPLVGTQKDPTRTTTFGVGQLLLSAAAHGAKRIILGLGGSATNDGGCGAAAACGVRFFDEDGQSFVPVGSTLSRIARIDRSGFAPVLRDVKITVMCDIDNPMFGKTGAAYVFAPQKGADAACVAMLDEGLCHLSRRITEDIGTDVSAVPGAGAAGAMGAGMLAFFGAELQSGIRTLLDTADFDRVIADANLIFTGEGKLDGQSLRGKVISGVCCRAFLQCKPVVAIVGGVSDAEIESAYGLGLTAVFPINRLPMQLTESAPFTADNICFTAESAARLLAAAIK